MRASEPPTPGADSEPRLIRLLPWLLAVAGVVVSLLLLWSLRKAELDAAQSTFFRDAMARVGSVRQEMSSSVEQLDSTVALFESSKEVEPDEFRTFTQRGLEHHPSLRALFWVELGPGNMCSIRYAEGEERAAFADRPDLRTDPILRTALDRSRSERGVVMSAQLNQLAGNGGSRVFAAVPVFGAEFTLDGFVAGLFDLERLLVPTNLPEAGPDFPFQIEDATGDVPTRVAGAALDSEGWPSFVFGERMWRISATPPDGYLAERMTVLPWVALALCLLATALLVAAVRATTSRARLKRLVERRTREVMAAYDTLAQEAKERLWAVSEAKQLEKRLREIIDLLPHMIYVKDWHGRFLLANEATAEAYGSTVDALTASGHVDLNTDDTDPDETLREDRILMESKLSSVVPAMTFVDARERRRILRVLKIPYTVAGDNTRALLCVATDITDQKHAEDILRGQTRILGQLAQGTNPDKVLAELVNAAEEVTPGMRCSVLLLAPDGRHLLHGSAPSLPRAYNEALDGLEIGPEVGSCGAAAHLGERVIVEDVMTHPNWAPYRELAERHNLRACWSQPIRASDGDVLGTFAMYYSERRAPETYEEELMESMAYMAGIAIEQGRTQSRR